MRVHAARRAADAVEPEQNASPSAPLVDDLRQAAFIDKLGRFILPKPCPLAFVFLTPLLGLKGNPQRVDLDEHEALAAVRESLGIGIGADRFLRDDALHASFLVSLDRGHLVRLLACHGPALRDDPPLRLTARDEHDLHAVRGNAVGQSSRIVCRSCGLTSP